MKKPVPSLPSSRLKRFFVSFRGHFIFGVKGPSSPFDRVLSLYHIMDQLESKSRNSNRSSIANRDDETLNFILVLNGNNGPFYPAVTFGRRELLWNGLTGLDKRSLIIGNLSWILLEKWACSRGEQKDREQKELADRLASITRSPIVRRELKFHESR